MNASRTEEVRNVLEEMIASLVDEENAVQVTAAQSHATVTFKVLCATNDVGKLIGKQGRTARSLRTVLSSFGTGSCVYLLDLPHTA